jgi:hypothetical protein
MRLTVGVPESEAAATPAILRLIRAASAWQVEAEEEGPVYVAVFDEFPRSLDPVIQLLDAASDLSRVQVSIDGRQVANVTELWSVLLCYQESLGEQNKEAYCARRAGQVGEAAGCPVRTCVVRCPFICARCFQVVRERGGLPMIEQLRHIAIQAEVEWCPNLRLPPQSLP